MQQEIERKINDMNSGREVKLHGHIKLRMDKSGNITVGKLCVKGIITVKRSDIIIDGSDSEIEVQVEDCTTSDWCLFFVHPQARNVQMRNLKIKVFIHNQIHCGKTFSIIYNTTYGCKIDNCDLEMYSDKQLNMVGIYNNGNLDTHMNTRADNMVVSNCNITVSCNAEEYICTCSEYGIFNYLANSISVTNTFLYVVNKGVGSQQRAVALYTNGRFGRFVGNNIKANGQHNVGLSKEKAHAYGVVNEGLYSIITSNNIIAEWAGRCVGVENKGEYAIIASNKILATHTIYGCCVCNGGHGAKIMGNVLTSTSRNARLIEHDAQDCIVLGNHMDVLMPQSECKSGCGIYAIGDNNKRNMIGHNIIRNVLDCGIFGDVSQGIIADNLIVDGGETAQQTGTHNKYLANQLDVRNICSL